MSFQVDILRFLFWGYGKHLERISSFEPILKNRIERMDADWFSSFE